MQLIMNAKKRFGAFTLTTDFTVSGDRVGIPRIGRG